MNRIRINPTTYTVCGLPESDVNAQVWRITIEWRGPLDSWAICHIGRCLSSRGRWDHEPLPSSRTEAFIRSHRFTLAEAKQKAIQAYPKLEINGLRVEDGKLVPA
jgi:hypothetical protein